MLSSPILRRGVRYICSNVFIEKHLCYICDDLFDHRELPLVVWHHKSAI